MWVLMQRLLPSLISFQSKPTRQRNFGVPEDKCFSGFDAYKKALAEPGVNYAILATPPGFRASHFKACVDAGKNIFCEKPVAVDGAGCRIMYESVRTRETKKSEGDRRHTTASSGRLHRDD